ncbi:MAG: hypothetical protein ACM358_14085 [Gemmatimonadota bacterium]
MTTNQTKIVKTNVTHEQLVAAQGGINGGDYPLWVECPDDYDVALITATDIVHDDQIRTVDEPETDSDDERTRPPFDRSTCTLPIQWRLALVAARQVPCDGCEHDRAQCGGYPREPHAS